MIFGSVIICILNVIVVKVGMMVVMMVMVDNMVMLRWLKLVCVKLKERLLLLKRVRRNNLVEVWPLKYRDHDLVFHKLLYRFRLMYLMLW